MLFARMSRNGKRCVRSTQYFLPALLVPSAQEHDGLLLLVGSARLAANRRWEGRLKTLSGQFFCSWHHPPSSIHSLHCTPVTVMPLVTIFSFNQCFSFSFVERSGVVNFPGTAVTEFLVPDGLFQDLVCSFDV